MATEHFCLRWNNHQSTLVSVFDNLLESGTLVDCTLAADGRYLKAHKVVLSACSPYLGMLLSQHYDKHPIIILKDVKFDELKAMLDYMYRGEVNISQEQLSTFLKAAETLQIKGLTDAGSDEGNGLQPNRPPSSNSTTSAIEDPQSPGPPGEGGNSPGPRKRKRNKHGDDGEGDSVSKVSLSEGSDRLSGTSVGSPSAKSASVKREPGDGEGDGQMSVDDSGEVVMMSRPGPSNGGTNNKAPWILSADSSGEEMQLTPGQDKRTKDSNWQHHEMKKVVEVSSKVTVLREEDIKTEIVEEKDPLEGATNSMEQENFASIGTKNPSVMVTMSKNEIELIIPDPIEDLNLGLSQEAMANISSKTNHKDRYLTGGSNIGRHNDNGREQFQGNAHSVPQSLSMNLKSSNTVDVADSSDKKKAKVKKTKLDFISKYRKILPLPEDNSCNASQMLHVVNNVQPTNSMNVDDRPTNPSTTQSCNQSTSVSSIENSSTGLPQTDASNHQSIGGHLMRYPSLTPPAISIPQKIQVSQISHPNPSLFSIPQQFQTNQIVNSTTNVVSIPPQSQTIQEGSSAMLSITPQFSMSPMQGGHIQMQFSNANLSVGNFQNAQFFSNSTLPQNQTLNNQTGVLSQQPQTMAHPVFVTSNIINSPNQFIASSPVEYNLSSACTIHPVTSNANHQSVNSSLPANVLSSIPSKTSVASSVSGAEPRNGVFIRTPRGLVRASSFFPSFQGQRRSARRGRGRFPPPSRPVFPNDRST